MTLLATTWTYVVASSTTQIFLISALALFVGLFVKVRSDAIRLTFLEKVSLAKIEKEQLHIPSFRVIVGVFLCSIALLLAALSLQAEGASLGANAYWWLPAAALFILGISAGILAELKWKRTRDLAFAAVCGSTLAFLVPILLSGQAPFPIVTQVTLLLLAIALAWRLFQPRFTQQLAAIILGTFVVWLLLFRLFF